MNKETIQHALAIAKELKKANPYIKIEISQNSVSVINTTEFIPVKHDYTGDAYPE